MYLNDLETYFEVNHINGVPIDFDAEEISIYLQMYMLLYADDTIIMSDCAESFQTCLDTFHKYCIDWKLTVNESKTKVIIFGARKSDNYNFRFGETILEFVDL